MVHGGTFILCRGYESALFSDLATTFRPEGFTTLNQLSTFDGMISAFGVGFRSQLLSIKNSPQVEKLKVFADR